MLKPKKLEKGQTIGVISPASPSYRKSEVYRSVDFLEKLGYKVKIAKNVNKTKGFVSASELDRAADFNEMFRRSDIDAIFVTQGGYGSAQIIPLIDFDVVKKQPKILTGFSDVTSLHLAINKLSNVVTFHGPSMTRFNKVDLTDYTKESFFKAITNTDPIGEIKLADKNKWLHVINKGEVEGEIIGGNLTLICATLGTFYEIDTDDKILFFEDVETEPWIMDHCLSHLRNAGKLEKVKGVVVDDCETIKPNKHNPGFYSDISLEDVLEYYFSETNIPVLYGLPIGHSKDLATLPLGVRARLDTNKKSFTILESGVI